MKSACKDLNSLIISLFNSCNSRNSWFHNYLFFVISCLVVVPPHYGTMDIYILPHLQAIFNATTACLLTAGYISIRKKNKIAHKACMLTAVIVAVLCTVSYLTFHFVVGATKFQGTGIIRPIYFLILGSHSVLAVATLPLVILALSRALKEKFDWHKKIARLTLPIWLYVSITGVVFYWMHYHLYTK